MGKRRRVFAVRPRTLVALMAILVVALGAALFFYLRPLLRPGSVELREPSAEATSTVSFAGSFPAEGEEPLANPLGIATDGEMLYIAESDAGALRVVDPVGGQVGMIVLQPAKGSTVVYPIAVSALESGDLAVVDSAASRVIVVSAQPADRARTIATFKPKDGPAWQPTAVAAAGDEVFVYDAASRRILVFSEDGAALRVIAGDLLPPLGVASGMCAVDNTLFVADTNAGRVVVLDATSGKQELVFPDRYALPRAAAEMDRGRIAVIDMLSRAIYVTSADGEREATIDASSVPEGKLDSPRAAAWLETDGRLYVTDAMIGRVMVYNIKRGEER